MSTGNNIKTIRLLKNFTQKHVASQLGISERWLSEIENEKVEISNEYLQRLSTAFDMSADEITHFHEKQIFNNTGNNSIFGYNNNYQNESVEKIEALYNQLLAEKDKTIAALQEMINTNKKNKI
jgi:transcriptional regulator with XRE-family HTH domain